MIQLFTNVYGPFVVTLLNWTCIFEWYMCMSNKKTHSDVFCLKSDWQKRCERCENRFSFMYVQITDETPNALDLGRIWIGRVDRVLGWVEYTGVGVNIIMLVETIFISRRKPIIGLDFFVVGVGSWYHVIVNYVLINLSNVWQVNMEVM